MSDEGVIKEFLVESYEGLDQLDREFVALEADPTSRERIGSIFRIIHTIKGTSGFLAFHHLEALTHAGESLLALLRDGTEQLTREKTQALLAMVDAVRADLVSIENSGRETTQDNAALIALLAQRGDKGETTRANAPAATAAKPAPPAPAAPAPAQTASDSAPAPVSNESVAAAPAALPPPAPVPAPVAAPSNSAVAAKADARPETVAASTVSDSNVRVDVGLLDTMMNLVGELVLARNQILQIAGHGEDAGLLSASQRLNLVTAELQAHVMKTRMQPIGNIWGKLPRVVRDLAVACGKQVRIEMSGRDTELDKTIIEAIKDPLTHIVRNSIDHGIEAPDVRAKAGKPKTGTLSLRAYHEGGQVNIEIVDDGAGLVLEKIRAKAIDRQLVSAERASRMNEHDLMQLVFVPGFSTASQVTNVSGRGVGMDVVKTNIERIGGTVELTSQQGKGTTIKIKIPLTLAIVPALIVASGGERYAIPQANLVELVCVDGEGDNRIEMVQGSQVYRLRGHLLPVVQLHAALNLPSTAQQGPMNLIVLAADGKQFGLIVDEIGETEEIVVKPLIKALKEISVFAGATIMGDGRVALILDTKGLAIHAHTIARGAARVAAEAHPVNFVEETGEDETLVIFSAGQSPAMAVPLRLVARLEEFERSKLERAGGGWVVQHRGHILPLICVAEAMGLGASQGASSVPVIVYNEGERSIGFMVDSLIDIVDQKIAVERCSAKPGLVGAAIVQGRVADVLDVDSLVRNHAPWLTAERSTS